MSLELLEAEAAGGLYVLPGEFAVLFRQRVKGGKAHVHFQMAVGKDAGQPGPCSGRLTPPLRAIPVRRLNCMDDESR